jgi:transposase-like protein
LKRSEIDRRLAAGEPTAQVARDYGINPSSLHRHRVNCLRLGSANAIKKQVARGSAAIALLPSKETLSGHYGDLCARIDQIVAQAQAEGSLAIAVSGLNSLRQTLDSGESASPFTWDLYERATGVRRAQRAALGSFGTSGE